MKNICQSKGFALEVAGLENPDANKIPVTLDIMPYGPEPSGYFLKKNFVCKLERGNHTVYMAELSEKEGNRAYYQFELVVPGLDEPLQIHGDNIGPSIGPHGYQTDAKKLHANIFIAFVPVTGIHTSFGTDADGAAIDLVSADSDQACCLRPLNAGFVYIFQDKSLWREIKVSAEGDFADIPVNTILGLRNNRTPGNQNTDKRIWLPVRINNKPCKGYRIAYSPVQWTAAYIQWLQKNPAALDVRTQPLDDLYAAYSKPSAGNVPERFGAGSTLGTGIERLGILTKKRGNLLREAVGESNALCDSAAWKNRDNTPPSELAEGGARKPGDQHLVRDVEVYEAYADIPQAILDQCRKEPQEENEGPSLAARHQWGLFYVDDPLYEALFYTQKIQAYAACLEGMTPKMNTPANATLCWQILAGLHKKPDNAKDYMKAAKEINIENLWDDVLPGSRKALRHAIVAMQMELAELMGHGSAYPRLANPIDVIKELVGRLRKRSPSGRRQADLPPLGIPGRMKKGTLAAERFRAAIRDCFTQDGPEYLNAWGIMREIFDSLSKSGAILDPFYIFGSPGEDIWQPYKAGKEVIFAMLEEKPDSGTGLSYMEMLFPEITQYTLPYDILAAVKDNEDNSGDSQCRFNTLRNLLNRYLGDGEELEAQLFKVCGVGQIVFQLYTQEILSNPDQAQRGMQHAMNLIRIAPGLERLVLASGDHMRDNPKLLLYTVLEPEKAEADERRVLIFQGTDGYYHLYRYLGDESFAFCRRSAKNLDHVPMFLAWLPGEDEADPYMSAAAHVGNVVATKALLEYDKKIKAAMESTAGLAHKKVPVPGGGFLNFLSVYITLTNQRSAYTSFSPTSSRGIINLLQLGSTVTTSFTSLIFAYNYAGNFLLGTGAVVTPKWLSRTALALCLAISFAEGVMDLENGDHLSGKLSAASAAFFLMALMWSSGGLAIPAAILMASAWYFRSSTEEIVLRKSLYGKENRTIPASRQMDGEKAFALLQKLYPAGEKNADIEDMTPDGGAHYTHLSYIKKLCKQGGVKDPRILPLLEECWHKGRIQSINWPLFSTPANLEQLVSYPRSGISLHLEGTPSVIRYSAGTFSDRVISLYLEKGEDKKLERFDTLFI